MASRLSSDALEEIRRQARGVVYRGVHGCSFRNPGWGNLGRQTPNPNLLSQVLSAHTMLEVGSEHVEVSHLQPSINILPTMNSSTTQALQSAEEPDPASCPTRKTPNAPPLQTVNSRVPYRSAVVSWALPQVQLIGEEQFADCDLSTVSHVVIK